MRPASRNQNAHRGRRLYGEVVFAAEKIERSRSTACSLRFNLFDGVKHRCMVAAVIEAANLLQAPAANVPRQIHGDLPAETSGLSITVNRPGPEVSRHGLLDSFQGDGPDFMRSINGVLSPPPPSIPRLPGPPTIHFRRNRFSPGIPAITRELSPANLPASP